MAVRIWPASSYTRVTLESNVTLKYRTFTLSGPERLVLDIEGLRLNSMLSQLSGKVRPEDPYIGQVRVGQFDGQTVRLVLELKQKVAPRFLTLAPAHPRLPPPAGAGSLPAPGQPFRGARRSAAGAAGGL